MGKYTLLTQWLLNCPTDSVKITFTDLEGILGFRLPESAYTHSRWWMNDVNHSQAKGWLDAGYISVNSNQPISTHLVEFSRKSITKSICPNKEITVEQHNLSTTSIQKVTSLTQINKGHNIEIGNYVFYMTPFAILEKDIPSPFLQYNGHTLAELLDKRHYSSLRGIIEKKYPRFLHSRINCFMDYLIQNDDPFYLKFLNKNGNDHFCQFGLTDKNVFSKKGLYLYEYKDAIVYIGRCRDNYYTRFNVNYGSIQPINCFKEGQSTNTHMNSLVNKYGDEITIYLCPLVNDEEIISAENLLIKQLQPVWNRKK